MAHPAHSPTTPRRTSAARGTGPLGTAQAQLARAVEILGYDDGLHEVLSTPRRELRVAVPLRRDDGSMRRFLMSVAESHVRGTSPDWASVLDAACAGRRGS